VFGKYSLACPIRCSIVQWKKGAFSSGPFSSLVWPYDDMIEWLLLISLHYVPAISAQQSTDDGGTRRLFKTSLSQFEHGLVQKVQVGDPEAHGHEAELLGIVALFLGPFLRRDGTLGGRIAQEPIPASGTG